MEIWAATGNQGKLKEYQALFQSTGWSLHSQREMSFYSSPEENGQSFLENARIKAKSLASVVPGKWVFAEDSGLVVPGLNGTPGIHSARYAGPNASDRENRAKLLKMMQIRSAQKREAEFIAVVVLFSPEKEEFVFEGHLSGKITQKELGIDGFGYDPVFIPDGEERTLAQMTPLEKNSI